MISIRERPPEVEERLVPGHWKGDLIKGACNRSSVGTLAERKTLFTVLSKMDDARAETAAASFANTKLTDATGIKIYFADPHSPWQRGINENTNELLRQYLPKGSDLSRFSQEELDAIAWKLNTRPRESLGYKCPAELFTPEAFDFRQHHASFFALGT